MAESAAHPTTSARADPSASSLAAEFAEALSEKDFERVAGLVHPDVDFRGLTPKRPWEAASPAELVSAVLEKWFEESDRIDEMIAFEAAPVSDREWMAYRFRGANEDGPFVVEQQAYFTVRDGRIDWLRILCSGYRPA